MTSVLLSERATDNPRPEQRHIEPVGVRDCAICGRPFAASIASAAKECQKCQDRVPGPDRDLEGDVRETIGRMTLAELCAFQQRWHVGAGPFSDWALGEVNAQIAAIGLPGGDDEPGDRWDGLG